MPATAPPDRVQPAITSIEELAKNFTTIIAENALDVAGRRDAVEGIMYASAASAKVKNTLAADSDFLKNLFKILKTTSPDMSTIGAALRIIEHMVSSPLPMTEDQKRMKQLQAYANASTSQQEPESSDDEEQTMKRIQAVFDAGVAPVLILRSVGMTEFSHVLIASIFFKLAANKVIRGPLVQQGAVKYLIYAYDHVVSGKDSSGRRVVAMAISRLLISTNPALIFGPGSPSAINAVIPLALLLHDDPKAEQQDPLIVFESLHSLANLASMDDENMRNKIIKAVFPRLDDFLISDNNPRILRATCDLICNLVGDDMITRFTSGKPRADKRMRLLIAHCGSNDELTRSAVGGALASMVQWPQVSIYFSFCLLTTVILLSSVICHILSEYWSLTSLSGN
jgi:hypothetical protein